MEHRDATQDERAARFSRALVDAAKALTSTLQLDEVLDTIMRLVARLLGPENWSLMLLDREKQELYFEIVVGNAANAIRHMRLPVGEGIAGWVVAENQPLVVSRVADDERFCDRMDQVSAFETESILAVPLSFAGRVVGVIELVSSADERRFTEKDLELLAPFADFAAIAINNARNFRRIEDLTLIDEWTSLYNARYLRRCVEEEVERANRYHHPVSLVFIDLDHFKKVNDTHGHGVGSLVLREVADVLWTIVRNTDRPARYGGDEFVVVMPETDKAGAFSVGERFRETVAARAFATRDGANVRITASLGLATFPDDAADATSLLEIADRAMYLGKARGRNIMIDAQDARSSSS
jgi:diguanylate cyclase (GGDEF)-like protein